MPSYAPYIEALILCFLEGMSLTELCLLISLESYDLGESDMFSSELFITSYCGLSMSPLFRPIFRMSCSGSNSGRISLRGRGCNYCYYAPNGPATTEIAG